MERRDERKILAEVRQRGLHAADEEKAAGEPVRAGAGARDEPDDEHDQRDERDEIADVAVQRHVRRAEQAETGEEDLERDEGDEEPRHDGE